MKKLFIPLCVLTLILVLANSIIFSWVGTDPNVELTFPDGDSGEGDAIRIPFSVELIITNTANLVAAGRVYATEDTNGDSVLDQAEIDDATLLVDPGTVSLPGPWSVGRYIVDSIIVAQGNYVFVWAIAQDGNGEWSGISAKALAWRKAEGYRP